ncbi:MAG: hypothetical protein ACR2NU_13135 [Aeoliella sp.]
MSRTVYVNFRDNGFWAYDVASSVFLKFLIDAAVERSASTADAWLGEAIERWRANAVVPNMGFYLDDDWSQSQIDTVIELCRVSADVLRKGGDIAAIDIASWPILEDFRIFPRGHDPVPVEPVARFGDAVVALVQGNLPEPPDRHWWFFTLDEDVDTIKMRSGA